MGKNKVKNGWMELPDAVAGISQIKQISDKGTFALPGNRYSRGFIIKSKRNELLWKNLFRVLRNENMECSLCLGEMGQTAILQIMYHSLKKQRAIDKEFDKKIEELNALLRVMDIKLLPMGLEERLEWLLLTFGGREELVKNHVWDYLADFNCKSSMQLAERNDMIKFYFLRRGNEITDKFVNEIRALSGDTRVVMHMEPVSNEIVQKNMKRLYGNYGNAGEEQNHFTNMSFMVILIDSPENMVYIEKDMKSICTHYGQEMAVLEETSWTDKSKNLAYISGTSSNVYRYIRCYQTQTIENLVYIV